MPKFRRMKFFPAAIELLQNSNIDPVSIENPNKKNQILHRFTGVTRDGELFIVQVKEEKKGGEKWLMSAFPKK
ncbi:MAG: hypothetical protein HYV41_03955 [Candidatus Magasanikbacteria bacterium]|nr:hypothetical protein [Candidatus Magasanikbacteria bacterium]